jgi:hypothetical protein
MKYTVTRKDGTVVAEGDKIVSFRDETWTFLAVTRGGSRIYASHDAKGYKQEFFPTVFNLTISGGE